MAWLRSLGVSIRLGEATVWNAYGLLFLAYISSDQALTSGLGAQHGASPRQAKSQRWAPILRSLLEEEAISSIPSREHRRGRPFGNYVEGFLYGGRYAAR